METAKRGLRLLSIALKAAPIPDPFKSAVTAIPDIALQIIEIVDAVKGNVEDAKDLALYIANVTETTMRPFETNPGELDKSPNTKKRLQEFHAVLEKIEDEMAALMSRRLRRRILSYDSDASKLAAMKQSVDDAINQLQLGTTIAVGHGVDVIRQDQNRMLEEQSRIHEDQSRMFEDQRIAIREQDEYNRMTAQQQTQQQRFTVRQQDMSRQERLDAADDILLSKLGTGGSGAAKKPPCLAGTREHVLGGIKEWIDDASSDSKHCYLLLGQASTGKSAIASSVANREKKSERLGAVFHFTRDEETRNKGAILALAQQFARWGDRRLRSKIASAIDSTVQDGLDIVRMLPENQFQLLIQEPMESLDSTSPTLAIVLDALDECDEVYATTLLRLFAKLLGELPHQVKLFITSRGEPYLRRCYDSEPLKSHVEKHSLVGEKVERIEEDISAYFKERLPDMVGEWVAEPSTGRGTRNDERLFTERKAYSSVRQRWPGCWPIRTSAIPRHS
ncbi:hypothetical protein FRB94_006046 [Tulasnella sp. JGI-2019a]|nr:hypothetical protein FRB94_006046 [Tulasnella sp. JGI-2019a]